MATYSKGISRANWNKEVFVLSEEENRKISEKPLGAMARNKNKLDKPMLLGRDLTRAVAVEARRALSPSAPPLYPKLRNHIVYSLIACVTRLRLVFETNKTKKSGVETQVWKIIYFLSYSSREMIKSQ